MEERNKEEVKGLEAAALSSKELIDYLKLNPSPTMSRQQRRAFIRMLERRAKKEKKNGTN